MLKMADPLNDKKGDQAYEILFGSFSLSPPAKSPTPNAEPLKSSASKSTEKRTHSGQTYNGPKLVYHPPPARFHPRRHNKVIEAMKISVQDKNKREHCSSDPDNESVASTASDVDVNTSNDIVIKVATSGIGGNDGLTQNKIINSKATNTSEFM